MTTELEGGGDPSLKKKGSKSYTQENLNRIQPSGNPIPDPTRKKTLTGFDTEENVKPDLILKKT